MHRLPFEDRSRAFRSEERRRESLHAHHGSQHTQSLWRTRGRGTQDHHEPHGNANSAGRIESDRRREVQPSNRRQAIRRHKAHDADDDGEESDEQRCRSHGPDQADLTSPLPGTAIAVPTARPCARASRPSPAISANPRAASADEKLATV